MSHPAACLRRPRRSHTRRRPEAAPERRAPPPRVIAHSYRRTPLVSETSYGTVCWRGQRRPEGQQPRQASGRKPTVEEVSGARLLHRAAAGPHGRGRALGVCSKQPTRNCRARRHAARRTSTTSCRTPSSRCCRARETRSDAVRIVAPPPFTPFTPCRSPGPVVSLTLTDAGCSGRSRS